MLNILRRFLVVTVFFLFILNSVTAAQSNLKSTGIGFRGSFYNPSEQSNRVTVTRHIGYSINNSINAGGCLYVFSRMSENTLMEFSIGSIASIEQELSLIAKQKVDLFNITPILFGLRYDFLQNQNQTFLQPYFSGGFGAYVLSDIKLVQKILREDVEVINKVNPGLYVGTGINLNISSWIALNVDGKYHLINVNPNYEHSGFEFGIGFNFSWGSF